MANSVTTTIKVNGSQAMAEVDNLGSTIAKATAAGHLLGSAISSGLGVAASALGKLTSGFQEFGNLQLSNISAASNLEKMTNLDFGEATASMNRFNAGMAKVAARLPGDTQLFTGLGRSLAEEVAASFTDATGNLDIRRFEQKLTSVATGTGVLAAQIGMSADQAGSQIAKMLSGDTTMKELKQLDFFQKNAAMTSVIEKHLEETGKSLADLTGTERLDLIERAAAQSEGAMRAMSGSVAGIFEGFRSSLFDLDVGLFGLNRDLDATTEGSQSAGQSFNRVVNKIFGEQGLTAQFAKLFKSLGLDLDPMKALADGLGKVGIWVEKTSKWVKTAAARLAGGGELGDVLNPVEITTKIGEWIGGLVNSMFERGEGDGMSGGSGFGKVVAAAFTGLGSFFSTVDWAAVGMTLVDLAKQGFMALGSFIMNLTWNDVGNILIGLGIAAAGALAVAGLAALAAMAAPFVAAGAAIVAAIGSWGLAAAAVIGGLVGIWRAKGEEITTAIARFFNAVNRWTAEMINKIPGVNMAVPREIKTESKFTSLDNKATGLDQMGLFDAIARERSAMPSGANMLIANDKEAIFNPRQQRGLLGALTSGGGRGTTTLNLGGVHIHGDISNPQALAKQVMQAIEAEWNGYQQRQIAPNY